MEEASLSIKGSKCPFLSGVGSWEYGGRGRAFPFTLFPEEKAEVVLLVVIAVTEGSWSTRGQKDPIFNTST